MERSWRGNQSEPSQGKISFSSTLAGTFLLPSFLHFSGTDWVYLASKMARCLLKRCFIVSNQRKHEEQSDTRGTLRRCVVDTVCQWEGVNPGSVFRDAMFQGRHINLTQMPCLLDLNPEFIPNCHWNPGRILLALVIRDERSWHICLAPAVCSANVANV